MELLLNILWLLIALAGLGGWCISRTYPKSWASGKPLQELTALACALVLAFFAVSHSDDLHADATICDDAATSRRHSLVWDCGHSPHQKCEQPHVSFAPAPSRLMFSANLEVAERLLPAMGHVDRDLKVRSLFGRSPPRSFTPQFID